MLLELNHVVKYVGERLLFSLGSLSIHQGDRVGLIGCNGSGKTTLLNIMAGTCPPDSGQIKRDAMISFVPQIEFDVRFSGTVEPKIAGELGVERHYAAFMSGGEKARYKFAAALSTQSDLLLLDEPSANLDMAGVELIQNRLREFAGALVLVSHDRQLLDAVCNVIWEIEDEKLHVYPGNYTCFLLQKREMQKRRQREYENYIHDRRELKAAILDRKIRSASIRQAPKRMGNSEARLHKMGDQKAKASLDRAVKAAETRLERLAVKEKPREKHPAKFDWRRPDSFYSKEVVRGIQVNCSFGQRTLLQEADFLLLNGQRVALVGPNGCGKTTLLKMIMTGNASIQVAAKARIGYFAQGMDDLDLERSILENVMSTSCWEEEQVRLILARLLFCREDVFKPVSIMSGGERTRVSLAKLLVGEANVLFLDEPTNYLDLPSLEALEEVLSEYQGTLLFASHDRQFVDKVATHLLLFEMGKLHCFAGNYSRYLAGTKEETPNEDKETQMILKHRRSEILSRLSVTKDKTEMEKLEQEYRKLSIQAKE